MTNITNSLFKIRRFNSIEEQFLIYWNKNSLEHFRISLIILFFTTLPYGLLDFYFLTSELELGLTIRYGIWTPILIVFYSLSYFPSFTKHLHNYSLATVTIMGIGVLMLIYWSKASELSFTSYYIGIGLTMAASIILRVRFIQTIMISAVLITGYAIVATAKQGMLSSDYSTIHPAVFYNNILILITFAITTATGAYTIEQLARNAFLKQKTLSESQQKATELSNDLFLRDKKIDRLKAIIKKQEQIISQQNESFHCNDY